VPTTAAGALVLAGLGGCGALGSTAAPTPSVAPAPSYTVAVVAVPTPKPRTPAPALKTTGVAWPVILASLTGYGQWLLANPDPALVGAIASPGCSLYNLVSAQATGLLRDQAYLQPVPAVFGPVSGPSPAAGSSLAVLGNQVTLDVTASRPAEAVLSRGTGNLQISAFDALPPTALRITLIKGADSKWRFCTVNVTADTGESGDPSVPLF